MIKLDAIWTSSTERAGLLPETGNIFPVARLGRRDGVS